MYSISPVMVESRLISWIIKQRKSNIQNKCQLLGAVVKCYVFAFSATVSFGQTFSSPLSADLVETF